jgi:hypothetical protein
MTHADIVAGPDENQEISLTSGLTKYLLCRSRLQIITLSYHNIK